jgi:c-di-GMP-binding flagellar brake protein YcgR
MPESETPRQTFRLEVNEPIVVQFEALERKMNLTLVDLSEGGCLLRATACIPNDKLSFKWTGPSKEPIVLSGSVVEAKLQKKVPEFGVHFDMPLVERDRLAAELHEIQRRQAFKSTEGPSDSARTQRQAYRAPVKFPAIVRIVGRAKELTGEANDLSIGGLLLSMTDNLEEGSVVEIRFDLPVDEVEVETELREVVERTPFGQRVVKKKVPLRPFEPIEVKLKIVKRIGSTPTGYTFGTAFTEMSPFVQEEIARFVHGYQLTQLRRAAALEK